MRDDTISYMFGVRLRVSPPHRPCSVFVKWDVFSYWKRARVSLLGVAVSVNHSPRNPISQFFSLLPINTPMRASQRACIQRQAFLEALFSLSFSHSFAKNPGFQELSRVKFGGSQIYRGSLYILRLLRWFMSREERAKALAMRGQQCFFASLEGNRFCQDMLSE